MISDNGPHYNSAAFKQFTNEWRFDHRASSPKYLQSNTLAERCVQSMKSAIKKVKSSSRDINMVLLCLRTTPIDYTMPSPGEVLFNRKLISNIPVRCTNHNTQKAELAVRLYKKQAGQKAYYDQHAKDLHGIPIGHVGMHNKDTNKWSPAVGMHGTKHGTKVLHNSDPVLSGLPQEPKTPEGRPI